MSPEELKKIVKVKYGQIAEQSDSKQNCCSSSSCCGPGVDYTVFSENYSGLEGYNKEADYNLGCGIPTDFADIKTGDRVLDLGSGAGNDCFVARAIVGENGRVTGLDMTEQMVCKARENCAKLNFKNVEFVLGDIEEMPFKDKLFDVVISNCVINLVPDKSKAFSEIFRVLKTGGHFCVSDVVLRGTLTEKMKHDAELYAGCVAGASQMDTYLEIIKNSGFSNIRLHKQKEIKLPYVFEKETGQLTNKRQNKNEMSGIFSITVSANK